MRKIIYENVAIGAIIQRIGECRILNLLPNLSSILSQQSPLEKLRRDLSIQTGDKLIILEFKSPTLLNKCLRYEDIKWSALASIANKVGDENVFLALIHSRLPEKERQKIRSPNGLYKFQCVAATTSFISLKELKKQVSIFRKDIIVERCKGEHDGLYANFPSCATNPLPPIIKALLHKHIPCYSCGGIRKHTLEISQVNASISAHSFAYLITSLHTCTLGYKLREYEDMLENVRELDHPLILYYSPILGLKVVLPELGRSSID